VYGIIEVYIWHPKGCTSAVTQAGIHAVRQAGREAVSPLCSSSLHSSSIPPPYTLQPWGICGSVKEEEEEEETIEKRAELALPDLQIYGLGLMRRQGY
jgi:hypothetical protein